MTARPTTFKQMRQAINDKVATDDAFRARLIEDPKGTIRDEYEVEIPLQYNIEVHEMSEHVGHLVLSPSSRLTEDDLRGVAGGSVPTWGKQDATWEDSSNNAHTNQRG
ncbi:MAG: hypothetical protein ACR2P7_06595 [bacterium]